MGMQKVAEKYQLSKWMQVIRERQESGLSIKDFCQEKGIQACIHWQRKLQAACMELSKQEEAVNCVPEGWLQHPSSRDKVDAIY